MSLQPVAASAGMVEDSELRGMTRRFWIGAALTAPVFLVAMAHVVPSLRHAQWVDGGASRW
jgi:Cu+-exporting ATPase